MDAYSASPSASISPLLGPSIYASPILVSPLRSVLGSTHAAATIIVA